jgi:hypothetical protein
MTHYREELRTEGGIEGLLCSQQDSRSVASPVLGRPEHRNDGHTAQAKRDELSENAKLPSILRAKLLPFLFAGIPPVITLVLFVVAWECLCRAFHIPEYRRR